MKKTFIIDGETVTYKDKVITENEYISDFMHDTGIHQISEVTELGQALENLNEDTLDPKTRTSGIDMKSRLHPLEISGVLAVDSLVAFGFLPLESLAFTRQKKRLSVSLQGKGREEIVQIVQGKDDRDERRAGGFGSGLKNIFGGKKE